MPIFCKFSTSILFATFTLVVAAGADAESVSIEQWRGHNVVRISGETPVTSLALDAIREVGPAGHFFGAAHTMSRYETAFYLPLVSNLDNHGS